MTGPMVTCELVCGLIAMVVATAGMSGDASADEVILLGYPARCDPNREQVVATVLRVGHMELTGPTSIRERIRDVADEVQLIPEDCAGPVVDAVATKVVQSGHSSASLVCWLIRDARPFAVEVGIRAIYRDQGRLLRDKSVERSLLRLVKDAARPDRQRAEALDLLELAGRTEPLMSRIEGWARMPASSSLATTAADILLARAPDVPEIWRESGGALHRRATFALAVKGDPNVLPELITLASDRELDGPTRGGAINAIGKFYANSESTEFLFRMLDPENWFADDMGTDATQHGLVGVLIALDGRDDRRLRTRFAALKDDLAALPEGIRRHVKSTFDLVTSGSESSCGTDAPPADSAMSPTPRD